MKKIILLILVLFLFLPIDASDEELYIPLGGDEETVIGFMFGDEEVQAGFFSYLSIDSEPGENVGAPNSITQPFSSPNSISEGVSIDKMIAGDPLGFDIRDQDIGVTKVEFTLRDDQEDVVVMATSVDSNPGIASPRSVVYKYIIVEAPAITGSAIESASISFAVDGEWIRKNRIKKDTILLERYEDNMWTPLTTVMTSETDNRLTFKSATPSFGYFVIRGDSELPAEELPIEEHKVLEEIPVHKVKVDYFSMSLIAIMIVLSAGYMIHRHKKLNKYNEHISNIEHIARTEDPHLAHEITQGENISGQEIREIKRPGFRIGTALLLAAVILVMIVFLLVVDLAVL